MIKDGIYSNDIEGWMSPLELELRSIDGILDKQFRGFDLFICNMEGYEIPLLSYLCGSGRISEMKSLAVQFHSDNKRVAEMLTKHYGNPIYEDWPHWTYWRNK